MPPKRLSPSRVHLSSLDRAAPAGTLKIISVITMNEEPSINTMIVRGTREDCDEIEHQWSKRRAPMGKCAPGEACLRKFGTPSISLQFLPRRQMEIYRKVTPYFFTAGFNRVGKSFIARTAKLLRNHAPEERGMKEREGSPDETSPNVIDFNVFLLPTLYPINASSRGFVIDEFKYYPASCEHQIDPCDQYGLEIIWKQATRRDQATGVGRFEQ